MGAKLRPNKTITDAIAHHRAGRLDDALALCEKAFKRKPAQPDALHLKGIISFQKGDAKEALEILDAAYHPGFPRWLLPIAEKSNTIGIPKAIPTRSCHDRLGSALDRVCLAMRNSAP